MKGMWAFIGRGRPEDCPVLEEIEMFVQGITAAESMRLGNRQQGALASAAFLKALFLSLWWHSATRL